MKLLKPSWVSHNGKLVQESVGPSWAFVVGEGGELTRRHGAGRHLFDLLVTEQLLTYRTEPIDYPLKSASSDVDNVSPLLF